MQNTKQTYMAYYKTNVQTSDQLALIIMMYDGAIRFLKKAIVKISEHNVEEAHINLVKSKDIVVELMSTLKMDQGGDIAQNLRNLYVYTIKKITEANLKKDPVLVQEAITVLDNLRQGWIMIKEQRVKQKLSQQELSQKQVNVKG